MKMCGYATKILFSGYLKLVDLVFLNQCGLCIVYEFVNLWLKCPVKFTKFSAPRNLMISQYNKLNVISILLAILHLYFWVILNRSYYMYLF